MRGLRAITSAGPRPSRSVTPGRNDSRNTSADAARRSTVSTPPVFFRSTAIDCRPRSQELCRRGARSAGTSLRRSTRTMLAPMSASLSEPNGSAPSPASSMMRMPSRGPLLMASPMASVQRREQHRVFALARAVDVDQDGRETFYAAGVGERAGVDRHKSVDTVYEIDDQTYGVLVIAGDHDIGVQ